MLGLDRFGTVRSQVQILSPRLFQKEAIRPQSRSHPPDGASLGTIASFWYRGWSGLREYRSSEGAISVARSDASNRVARRSERSSAISSARTDHEPCSVEGIADPGL